MPSGRSSNPRACSSSLTPYFQPAHFLLSSPLLILGLPLPPSAPPVPILPSHQGHLKGHTLYGIGPWVAEEHSGARATPVSSQSHALSLSATSSLPPPSSLLLWVHDAGLRTNSPRSPASSSCCPQGLPPSSPPLPTAVSLRFSLIPAQPLQMACLFSSPQMTQFEGAISCQGLTNEHPVPKQPGSSGCIRRALPNHCFLRQITPFLHPAPGAPLSP